MEDESNSNMNKNNLSLSIEKNIFKIEDLLQFKSASSLNKSGSNNSNSDSYVKFSISLMFFYYSEFKFKINWENFNSESGLSQLIQISNDILKLANSKFILSYDFTQIEFINFVIYFFTEFDVINDFIDYLAKINKKYLTPNFNQIVKIVSTENFKDELITSNNNHTEDNILKNFNTLTFTIKNLKKQLDSFINLSFKLNEIKKNDNNMIRYDISLKYSNSAS